MAKAKQVVIIGAGPGGLAAAMLLARAGVQGQGDRAAAARRRPDLDADRRGPGGGFRFDLGPTFFLYPRVLEEIFAAVGRDLHDEVELVRLDPQYHLVFGGGGELLATPDVARMERAIAALSPARRRPVPPLPGRQPGQDGRSSAPSSNRRSCSWRDLLSPHLLKMLPLLRPWLSLDGELGRYFRDPRVRLALTFQSKYLGMSPFNCPSLFSILSFLEYEYGVFHPIGGCGAVTEAMARVAEDLGVEIRSDDECEEILFEGRRAVGVRSTSGIHAADALVDQRRLRPGHERLVPDRLRRRWTDREDRHASGSPARPSCSISASRAATTTSGHHTIYLAQRLPAEPRRDREPRTSCSRRPVLLRPERLRDRPVAWPRRA